MKFILDESMTLEEAGNRNDSRVAQLRARRRQTNQNNTDNKLPGNIDKNFADGLRKLLLDQGYTEERVNATIDLVAKDPNQEKKYREIVAKYQKQQAQKTAENPNQTAETSEDSVNTNKTEPEKQQPQGNSNKDKLIRYLQAASPDAFEEFKKGIKGKINDPNFPFTRLMNSKKFIAAIGADINESLNEAGLGLIGNKLVDKIKNSNTYKNAADKYRAKNTKPISKLIRAYNAVMGEDERLVNQYLDKAKDFSILCRPELYLMKDKQNIANALNIDMKI